MMNMKTMILAAGLALGGCGSTPEPVDTTVSADPNEPGPAHAAEKLDDLALDANAIAVGIERLADDGFFVPVEIRNDGEVPMVLRDLRARVEVQDASGDELCRHPDVGVVRLLDEAPAKLMPGERRRVDVQVDCTIERAGDYRVLTSVALEGEDDVGVFAPTDAYLSVQTNLAVTSAGPAVDEARPEPADVTL